MTGQQRHGHLFIFNRRSSGRACLAVVLLFASLPPLLGAQRKPEATSQPAAVESVGVISLSVSDLDRAVDFYTRVLTFEKTATQTRRGDEFARIQGLPSSATARVARLRLGDESIELVEYRSPPGRAIPADAQSNDRWFQHVAIIVRDMDSAYAKLEAVQVRHASDRPQRLPDWNKNAGGIQAYYFRDPDGHFLEILQFPAGKGDPKWRRPTDRLFLGIDHTAIVVADTDASLRFYRDTLGMKVAGTSENYGSEQAALNHVPNAHLRITTLRAASGPGIELLEYLQPRTGRPYPADAGSNDLLSWQTTCASSQAGALADRLRIEKTPVVSRESAHSRPSPSVKAGDLLVRDPDGHLIRITDTP